MNPNMFSEELYLALYDVTVSCTIYGKEKQVTTQLVAESNLEALDAVRDFLVEQGAENFSAVCRQRYVLLWAFVAV